MNCKYRNGFIKICKMSQSGLKRWVKKRLKKAGYEPEVGDGYVYAKGNLPVLLTAHLDTVHEELPQYFFFDGNKISSPQGIGGDDRCGVYIITEIIRRTELRPSILFCEDEEIGSKGAEKFLYTKSADGLSALHYMIELDRANDRDAVFYDCANDEFTEWIERNTGFVKSYGSFSDISLLAPDAGVAAVNLSCGYYKAHTKQEYVVTTEMSHTMDTVINLLRIPEPPQFEYIEDRWRGYGDALWSKWNDYGFVECEVTYCKNGSERIYTAYGDSEEEALLNFFQENQDVCYGDIINYQFV